MAQGMNSMPTARRGRSYFQAGANDNRGVCGVCSIIFIILFLLLPPFFLLASESSRHQRYLALRQALDSDIIELNHDVDADMLHAARVSSNVASVFPAGTLVHGTSSSIEAVASDAATRVAIPGALCLQRVTEYCQWQEIPTQQCQTCHRTVRAKDGSSKEESYQCNCVTRYDYVKGWRNHRINSMLFNQPGAHHNPQRDPLPSRTFAAQDALLTFREDPQHADDSTGDSTGDSSATVQALLDPAMLSSGVRGQPYRSVDFVPNGTAPPPSFFSRLFASLLPTDRTRYEPLHLLRDMPTSPAATQDHFVYVDQGGYFFSPYESSTFSQLMNYFVQYMEGSLFDWQIGDLMPSCTAGDIRFHYQVQDPLTVSVLGQILPSHSAINTLEISPRLMTTGSSSEANANHDALSSASIGFVHRGTHSAQQMIIAEDTDSRNRALIFRAILLLWSIPVSRLVGVALHREIGTSSLPVQIMSVAALSASFLGVVWLGIWGISISTSAGYDTVFLILMGGYLGMLSYRMSNVRGKGRWWNALWCRIATWANTPPEWRVEDTYTSGGAIGSDFGDEKGKRM